MQADTAAVAEIAKHSGARRMNLIRRTLHHRGL